MPVGPSHDTTMEQRSGILVFLRGQYTQVTRASVTLPAAICCVPVSLRYQAGRDGTRGNRIYRGTYREAKSDRSKAGKKERKEGQIQSEDAVDVVPLAIGGSVPSNAMAVDAAVAAGWLVALLAVRKREAVSSLAEAGLRHPWLKYKF